MIDTSQRYTGTIDHSWCYRYDWYKSDGTGTIDTSDFNLYDQYKLELIDTSWIGQLPVQTSWRATGTNYTTRRDTGTIDTSMIDTSRRDIGTINHSPCLDQYKLDLPVRSIKVWWYWYDRHNLESYPYDWYKSDSYRNYRDMSESFGYDRYKLEIPYRHNDRYKWDSYWYNWYKSERQYGYDRYKSELPVCMFDTSQRDTGTIDHSRCYRYDRYKRDVTGMINTSVSNRYDRYKSELIDTSWIGQLPVWTSRRATGAATGTIQYKRWSLDRQDTVYKTTHHPCAGGACEIHKSRSKQELA
jgi:hypothetical protein